MSATRKHRTRVIVGMSGGVDSSVAALQLLEAGYRVEGLFMKNWQDDDAPGHCAAAADLADTEAVCERLEIPLHRVSFAETYRERVFSHFLAEYAAGRTPNPDILCNTEIKFRAFLDHALGLGAQAIATGHYARTSCNEGQCHLLKGRDAGKDQSYFLHGLTQAQLRPVLFPLGGLDKVTVRERARTAGLPNADKKDSTGICFIGERPFREFLASYLPARPGRIVSPEGTTLGTHQGLMYYTIGQRQGLGIGGCSGARQAPWYVVAKVLEANQLIVAQGSDNPLLYSRALRADHVHWIAEPCPALPLRCHAKVRYRQREQPCTVRIDGHGGTRVHFDTPQWAVTPGQSVVFYDGELCLGGGVIDAVDTATVPGEAVTEQAAVGAR